MSVCDLCSGLWICVIVCQFVILCVVFVFTLNFFWSLFQFELILKTYGENANNGKQILHRLDQVRMRGRKKVAFG